MDWTLIRDGDAFVVTFVLRLFCWVLIGCLNDIAMDRFAGLVRIYPLDLAKSNRPRAVGRLIIRNGMVQAYVQGTGFSGIIASALLALTNAAFSDASDGLRMSARVFFIASPSLCCILSSSVNASLKDV